LDIVQHRPPVPWDGRGVRIEGSGQLEWPSRSGLPHIPPSSARLRLGWILPLHLSLQFQRCGPYEQKWLMRQNHGERVRLRPLLPPDVPLPHPRGPLGTARGGTGRGGRRSPTGRPTARVGGWSPRPSVPRPRPSASASCSHGRLSPLLRAGLNPLHPSLPRHWPLRTPLNRIC